MWQNMAAGNAIDDQRSARWPFIPAPAADVKEDTTDAKPSTSNLAQAEAQPEDDPDSDFDPNDIEPVDQQGGYVVEGALPPAGGPVNKYKDAYDMLDDEDDYE